MHFLSPDLDSDLPSLMALTLLMADADDFLVVRNVPQPLLSSDLGSALGELFTECYYIHKETVGL